MQSPRLLTVATMMASFASFVSSTSAFIRPHLRPCSSRLETARRCHLRWQAEVYGAQYPSASQVDMLLGVDTSAGLLGLGALGALRAFASSITPKRVRVVTDIDDTVKSSGNKRLLGIPLGGVDAQCERTYVLLQPTDGQW